jgi:hypothetical protein
MWPRNRRRSRNGSARSLLLAGFLAIGPVFGAGCDEPHMPPPPLTPLPGVTDAGPDGDAPLADRPGTGTPDASDAAADADAADAAADTTP